VESPEIKRRIMDAIIPVHLRDNAQCSELDASGEYRRLRVSDEPPLDSQRWMLDNQGVASPAD
jgi:polyphosphate kinase